MWIIAQNIYVRNKAGDKIHVLIGAIPHQSSISLQWQKKSWISHIWCEIPHLVLCTDVQADHFQFRTSPSPHQVPSLIPRKSSHSPNYSPQLFQPDRTKVGVGWGGLKGRGHIEDCFSSISLKQIELLPQSLANPSRLSLWGQQKWFTVLIDCRRATP